MFRVPRIKRQYGTNVFRFPGGDGGGVSGELAMAWGPWLGDLHTVSPLH